MTFLDEPRAPVAIAELFECVQPRLGRIFARFRLPAEDAEDILQQSFLDLVYKQGQVYNPEAWLVATVKNRCIMYWRRRRRQAWEAMDEALLDVLAEPQAAPQRQVALRRDLARAMARLPERCQRVLMLRYGLGCGSEEVAERLGYRSKSIRTVTSRCVAALTRELLEVGVIAASGAGPVAAPEP